MFKIQRQSLKTILFVIVLSFSSMPVAFSDEETVDDFGFNQVIDNKLVTNRLNVNQEFKMPLGLDSQFESKVELESDNGSQPYQFSLRPNSSNTLEGAPRSNLGFKIKRLNASWQGKAGSLTVGSDWSNFQNFLESDKRQTTINDDRSIANQVKWRTPNGFSIALEGEAVESLLNISPAYIAEDDVTTPYTGLVLSWQGNANGLLNTYHVSLEGKKINLGGESQSFKLNDERLNWGVNVGGGWQIGDLFAALSVTYGNGIDSYLLSKYGNDLLVTANPNATVNLKNSLDVRPSLYYQLNDTSNIYMVLSRYTTKETTPTALGVDTLDTVHMGYNWRPWLGTEIGVEFVGRNSNGTTTKDFDNQINFGAKTNF